MAAEGRERAVEAAWDVWLEHGYHGSSMQQIAAEAGVAKSLLHYHWPSKAALLLELVSPYLDAMEEALDRLSDREPMPREILRAHLDVLVAHRRPVQLLNTDAGVREQDGLGERYLALQQRWRRLLTDDEVLAAAALGVLTRPAVFTDAPLEGRGVDLVAAAEAVLAAGNVGRRPEPGSSTREQAGGATTPPRAGAAGTSRAAARRPRR